MNTYSFINTKENILSDLRPIQHVQKNTKRNLNPNFKSLVFLVLFLSAISLSYYFATNYHQNVEILKSKNSNKLEFLIQKTINNEQLTKFEWNELCQLLSSEKGINVNDCESCQDYLRALLGGKHHKWMLEYMQKPDKEVMKGIKSIEKLIIEHQNKIKAPDKFYPDWKTLRPEQQKDLVNNKWNKDIKRQTEQKNILNCILKNR